MTRLRVFVPVLALAAAITVAGCHKKVAALAPPPPVPPPAPAAPAPPPPPAPLPAAPRAAQAPPPRPLTEEEIFARKSLDELNAERPLTDAYFDYNQSSVRADAQPALQKDADWMKKWTSTQVTIEGHCDERGSAGYNLGLGSRRATAVKDYLVNLGIPATRITIVSKGKEAPVCNDKNESCYQQNRRGHFIITAK